MCVYIYMYMCGCVPKRLLPSKSTVKQAVLEPLPSAEDEVSYNKEGSVVPTKPRSLKILRRLCAFKGASFEALRGLERHLRLSKRLGTSSGTLPLL